MLHCFHTLRPGPSLRTAHHGPAAETRRRMPAPLWIGRAAVVAQRKALDATR